MTKSHHPKSIIFKSIIIPLYYQVSLWAAPSLLSKGSLHCFNGFYISPFSCQRIVVSLAINLWSIISVVTKHRFAQVLHVLSFVLHSRHLPITGICTRHHQHNNLLTGNLQKLPRPNRNAIWKKVLENNLSWIGLSGLSWNVSYLGADNLKILVFAINCFQYLYLCHP